MNDKIEQMPLCEIHQSIENSGNLELHYGNDCVACSLNERSALLELLATMTDTPEQVNSTWFLESLLHELKGYRAKRKITCWMCADADKMGNPEGRICACHNGGGACDLACRPNAEDERLIRISEEHWDDGITDGAMINKRLSEGFNRKP